MAKERYYSLSLLRGLAYDDDVNGNCDGMIDFTVVDSIDGADVEPVRHGEWIECGKDDNNMTIVQCSICQIKRYGAPAYCSRCGARMDRGNKK